MRPDPTAATRRWRDDPRGRFTLSLWCAVWAAIPHGNNNFTRKIVTIAVVGVWVAVTLGHSFYGTPLPDASLYGLMSAMVGALFAKMHDIELRRFAEDD